MVNEEASDKSKKNNFGFILPVMRVCRQEIQLSMKPYIRGPVRNKSHQGAVREHTTNSTKHTTQNSHVFFYWMEIMPRRDDGKMKAFLLTFAH